MPSARLPWPRLPTATRQAALRAWRKTALAILTLIKEDIEKDITKATADEEEAVKASAA